MNSNQIFELALGFEKAWFVKDLEVTEPAEGIQGQIDIFFLILTIALNALEERLMTLLRKTGSSLTFFSINATSLSIYHNKYFTVLHIKKLENPPMTFMPVGEFLNS